MTDFTSESWPASDRYIGRLRVGITGRFRRNTQRYQFVTAQRAAVMPKSDGSSRGPAGECSSYFHIVQNEGAIMAQCCWHDIVYREVGMIYSIGKYFRITGDYV